MVGMQRGAACSHLSKPASIMQKEIIFLRSSTARHIGNDFLLKSGRLFFVALIGFSHQVMPLEILQVQPNISMKQRHFFLICSPLMTLQGMLVHLFNPTQDTLVGVSLATLSACQDALIVKTGKHSLSGGSSAPKAFA